MMFGFVFAKNNRAFIVIYMAEYSSIYACVPMLNYEFTKTVTITELWAFVKLTAARRLRTFSGLILRR